MTKEDVGLCMSICCFFYHWALFDTITVQKMKEIGERVYAEKTKGDKDLPEYIMGFVTPPFNSVLHLHLHVISLPLTTWWPRSLAFGKLIFYRVDDLITTLSAKL